MRTTRSLAATLLALTALTALAAGIARGGAEVRAPRAQLPLAAQPISQAAARELYLQACASCHGADGDGSSRGPTLIGVGPASVDFMLTTGRMPFAGQAGEQAKRKPVAFSEEQIAGLVDYVVGLSGEGPVGPAIPVVHTHQDLLARGHELFIGNCAACHGATGQGGAVGGGALAPPLRQATSLQVVEAMLVGPGQMPIFDLPQQDLDAVATYVDYLQTAPDPGGFSIGGIGPVPEGFVGWVLGAGLLLVTVYLIGRDWHRSAVGGDGD
jgi:ubiquinol-cytochrome c reductase cytochrome c subunit